MAGVFKSCTVVHLSLPALILLGLVFGVIGPCAFRLQPRPPTSGPAPVDR